MRAGAILLFLLGYCAFSFSQNFTYSRKFEGSKKNLPLAIINNHDTYFFVLRYNKAAHDITIERRAKPSAEIISFTPLKLDSVNASWFDYQKLDYLFFEHNKKLCFLFEKVLNSKKSLYLKIVDSLSKSSGFIELASLEKDNSAIDFSFEYKIVNANNILIVSSQIYQNLTSKKVMLYDIEKRKMVWVKKLPFENASTGYSTSFECNENQDLFYACIKSRIISFQRKYINHMQTAVPVFFYDDVTLVSYLNTDPPSVNRVPLLANISNLSGVKILTMGDEVNVQCQYALQRTEGEEPKVYFLNKKLNKKWAQEAYQVIVPLDPNLQQRLTFYDGSDQKNPANKDYKQLAQVKNEEYTYSVTERIDENYYKELIAWKADVNNGQIIKQFIVPRRIYGFKNKTRIIYAGETMPFLYQGKVCFIIAEAIGNFTKSPTDFKFSKFRVVSNPWRCNIMMYSINGQDQLEKKLINYNSDFDMVPLRYQAGNAKDMIFYMTSGKYEKFAFLN